MSRDTIDLSELPGNPPDPRLAFQDASLVRDAVAMLNEHAATLDVLQAAGGGNNLPVFNVVSYGAHGDGERDDREKIQDAINAAVTAGGGIVYFPAGVYTVSRFGSSGTYSLDITGNNVTLQGVRGASWLQHPAGMPDAQVSILRIDNATNTTVRDMGFDGNWGNSVGGTDSQAGLNHTTQGDPRNHGIFLRGATATTIVGCKFRQCYGDGIWIGTSSQDFNDGAVNVRIDGCDFDMCARDGISLAQKCEQVTIRDCRLTNIYTQAIDFEPIGSSQYAREVVIDGCHLGNWWNPANTARSINAVLAIVGGGGSANPWQGSFARAVRVTNCVCMGSISIDGAYDVTIKNNRIVCNWVDGYSVPGIYMFAHVDDITIADNWIFVATKNAPATEEDDPSPNYGIACSGYIPSTYTYQPRGVTIRGNRIHGQNDANGILVYMTGGHDFGGVVVPGETGTATGVTSGTLTKADAGWTANQWVGYRVRMGSAISVVTSNTTDTLTIVGWGSPLGETVDTPTAGDYELLSDGGIVDIFDNAIDLTDEGYGAGGFGIHFVADRAGMRVRIDRNQVKNAVGSAIKIDCTNRGVEYVQVKRNHAWCNAPTDTTNHTLFVKPENITKLIMGDNTQDDGVTNPVAGVVNGYWLIEDGLIQRFAGFGSPEGVVAARVGSTYNRRDAGLWIKTTDDGLNTGWTSAT